MLSIKRIVLCVLGALVLSGLGVSAASAASPAWWVNGKLLAAGVTEPLKEVTEVSTPFVIKAGTVAIECTAIRLEKSSIEGEKTAKFAAIGFEGCSVSGAANCSVSAFKTNPLTAKLEGSAKAFKLNFEPTTKGAAVATIKLAGAKCGTPTVELTGTMACKYPNVESAAVVHELEFTVASGSKLKALGSEATLTGIDKFKLASELTWFVE